MQLANNTPYGLAASVWTENINLALDVAPRLKAGVVWVNATNLFDAAAGFGGYRESGFGREGGREGMWEYLKARDERRAARKEGNGAAPAEDGAQGAPPEQHNGDVAGEVRHHSAAPDTASARQPSGANGDGASAAHPARPSPLVPRIDRTPKLFIGGKQARPDSGYSRQVRTAAGALLGEVGEGNRKDVRNAVEAAHAAAGWERATAHARAQVLYYVAENLSARADEFARRITDMTGAAASRAADEVDAAIARLFTYAAWADKYDGAVHNVPIRGVALAMHEPVGVIGAACPETFPLLGLVSLVAPAIAMGNAVVAVPSEAHPLAATDFYSVLETSDVPPGVVNIVTGAKDALAKVLAEHDDVDAVWYFGTRDGATAVERASASNMKRTWAEWRERDWLGGRDGEGREFLREATQVKNVWIPYGE